MKTIAIMNNKGGVGKTVTAINLADVLVREHKKRVVLIDCDGQANLTRFFLPGFDPALNSTTATLLAGDTEPLWSDNLIPVAPDLSLLPGSPELYQLDHHALRNGTGRPERIRDFVEAAAYDGEVDFIIFDCPPGYTLASVGALMAADAVVIPMLIDGFSFDGVRDIQQQILGLQQARVDVRIAGVLITQWHNSDVVRAGEALLRSANIPVFHQTIRRTNKVPESTFDRHPVGQYSPTSAAARDYRAWVPELLEVLK